MKIDKTGYALALPIIYLGLIVLVFGENIKWFYGLSIALVIGVVALLYKANLNRYKTLGYALLVLGSIGMAAALLLTLEKFAIATDPNYIASCTVSPIVSCNNVVVSDQAEAINGIPNPLFGVFGFAAMITAGMGLIAGAKKLHKYYWWALLTGATLGSIFSMWLIFQAFYRIGSLCLYCMAVWYVSFTTFWFVLDFNLKEKVLTLPKNIDEYIVKNRNLLITLSILAVVLLIYFRWMEYWNGLI